MKQSDSIVRSAEIATNLIGDELLIFDDQEGLYFGTGVIGARIWEYISAPICVSEIIEKLRAEFDVKQSECETDVVAFLNDLKSRNLISVVN